MVLARGVRLGRYNDSNASVLSNSLVLAPYG